MDKARTKQEENITRWIFFTFICPTYFILQTVLLCKILQLALLCKILQIALVCKILQLALLCKILQLALLCKRPKRSIAFSQLWSPPPLCRCLRPAPLRQKPTAPKCSDLPFNSETQFPIDNLNVGSVPCKHVGGIPHEHQFVCVEVFCSPK